MNRFFLAVLLFPLFVTASETEGEAQLFAVESRELFQNGRFQEALSRISSALANTRLLPKNIVQNINNRTLYFLSSYIGANSSRGAAYLIRQRAAAWCIRNDANRSFYLDVSRDTVAVLDRNMLSVYDRASGKMRVVKDPLGGIPHAFL